MKAPFLIPFLMLWPLWALAQSGSENTKVQETITAQLEAFRAADEDAAFAFASPFIQRMFETPQAFGDMVRGGYPMVWGSTGVTFLDQIARNDAIWQRLVILGPDGGEHWFAYELIQIDGHWRINGVYPIEAPDLSA